MDPFNPTEFEPLKETKKEVIQPELSVRAIDVFTRDSYYSEKWMPLISGTQKLAGFNLFAMLFGESWCIYRKQYKLGAFIFSISIIVEIAASQLYINFIDSSYRGQELSFFIGALAIVVLVRLPLGILANRIYYKHVRANIESLIKQGLPAEYFTAQLKKVGGVNIGGAIFCQAVFALANRFAGTFGPIANWL